MIIVRLIGGLGNQMFQYAAARRLAEKHSTILKLDIFGFEQYKLHRYSLHCFHIWEYLATHNEIKYICKENNFFRKIKKKLSSKSSFFVYQNQNLLTEKFFHFDPEILDASNDVFLDGYWQSEKYFADITNILQREFVVKYQQDPISAKFAEQIQTAESVSLHVRRTDYVNDSLTNQIHGTCNQEYYTQAVQYIGDRVPSPHFFIFSDEPEWAKHNLNLGYPITIVDCNNASRNYEDLRLMSLCKHNIIANSSFSWWGAWLNRKHYKIVIAPKHWFNDPSRNSKDLIPESWIKI
ncbi:alpha-1,2-fucosyltransferase [Synechocystis sp. FACHB-383]|uniref:alpha-1,2-fucosyltransferase n=1 Tax=Synechocystis sp. FACHB-383 TaxID=2692864 RepID=UPI001685F1A6|nr:alpha-1,2-fucosyltransferase [Synechocystis sp. FACHB-383]MBD2655386.1 alpha-1,2-fucosyltransferase [Synechocystis sp. FACHB-383]